MPAAQRVAATQPRPVQVIFEFRTEGAANTRATNMLREQVIESVRTSGVFSEVSESPVSGGAILSLTIDNIPEENAAGQGFVTGLTMGMAGSTVTDFYVGNARYSAGSGAAPISVEQRHALHSIVGAGSGPENMVQAENPEQGIRTVICQLTEHLVFGVARAPGFAPSAAAATTPAS